jgi:hypothetical protein
MTSRSPLMVTFKGEKYAGEYEVEDSLVRVFFEDREKTTQAQPLV